MSEPPAVLSMEFVARKLPSCQTGHPLGDVSTLMGGQVFDRAAQSLLDFEEATWACIHTKPTLFLGCDNAKLIFNHIVYIYLNRVPQTGPAPLTYLRSAEAAPWRHPGP